MSPAAHYLHPHLGLLPMPGPGRAPPPWVMPPILGARPHFMTTVQSKPTGPGPVTVWMGNLSTSQREVYSAPSYAPEPISGKGATWIDVVLGFGMALFPAFLLVMSVLKAMSGPAYITGGSFR